VRNDLAERRHERGWSQGQLAEELGVSRQTVISLEKGRFDPSLPLAFRIAALFDCRIEDVFTPDGDGPAGARRTGRDLLR
jgi:putative transcriptional regulator